MAINKKLIHFNERSEFDKRLANNEILDTSIVFIKSSQEIWTHGQVYKCSDPDLSNYVTESELQELLSPIQTELTNKASKADVDAVIEEIKKDNLFQYPTEREVSRLARACYKRLNALDNEELIRELASAPVSAMVPCQSKFKNTWSNFLISKFTSFKDRGDNSLIGSFGRNFIGCR